MDASTFRTILRYGAVLSVLGMLLAIVAFMVGGPLAPLGPPLAFLMPLCGFYFIGAVLQDVPRYHILGEELMRGIVWYGGSLLGWATIITSSPELPATAFTGFGLPVLTALGISLVFVGIRMTTGLDLKVQTEGGQLLTMITVAIAVGFIIAYLVLSEGRSPMLFLLYLLSLVVGVFFWRRHWRSERSVS